MVPQSQWHPESLRQLSESTSEGCVLVTRSLLTVVNNQRKHWITRGTFRRCCRADACVSVHPARTSGFFQWLSALGKMVQEATLSDLVCKPSGIKCCCVISATHLHNSGSRRCPQWHTLPFRSRSVDSQQLSHHILRRTIMSQSWDGTSPMF